MPRLPAHVRLLTRTLPLAAAWLLASARPVHAQRESAQRESAQRESAQRVIDLDAATIPEINAAFDAGTLTSVQLVSRYLARIAAYDRQGPAIRAVLALNPNALETARQLDVERKSKGRRSPLHGIPVVLKDNFDTRDLPTTGGSVLLKGYVPARDAVLVQQLRDAGAIVLAKVNMSEFASAGMYSSLGGQTRNPHDPAYAPGGSSGGTGAAVAAAFAQFGLGTDTGGSIRGPASINGIVSLKPTLGLLSRTGIIPLALSFDTGGPMARSVTDIAIALGVLTGVDTTDTSTRASAAHAARDYTPYLRADALKGARIGIARDFTGADAEVDWVVEAALETMRQAGATIVEVRFPPWMLNARDAWYNAVRFPEFPVQIAAYLKATPAAYPKTLAQLLQRARAIPSLGDDDTGPNASRWSRFVAESASGSMDNYRYRSVRDHALPMMREVVQGMLDADRLDAMVYPPATDRAAPIGVTRGGASAPDASNIANLTGFPDLTVPAGFSDNRLPIGLSFLGAAWSEPKLIALAYSFEQATAARRRPRFTPALAGDAIRLPR
jgi:amidase